MRSILPIMLATFYVAAAAQDPLEKTRGKEHPDQVKEQINRAIEMLDSPRFRDRVEASARLRRAGIAAIESLQRVASDGAAEASSRAFDLLGRHHQSDNPALQEAAADAIAQIAEQSENPRSKTAQQLLQPDEPAPNSTVRPPRAAIPLPRVQIQRRRLPPLPALQIPPLPAIGNRRVGIRVKMSNGTRETIIRENDEETRFVESADGIEVEKSDGNGGTITKKYKNLDQLKEKDPEAHRTYRRVPVMNGKIKVRERIPAQPGRGTVLPPEIQKRHEEILKRHEQMRQQHIELHEQLRKRQRTPQRPPPQPLEPLEPVEIDISDVIEV